MSVQTELTEATSLGMPARRLPVGEHAPARTRLARLAARVALPAGSVPVAVGLAVSGLTTYAFLVVSGRVLGPERYAALSALWGLVFMVAGGAYVPFEQELGRAIAARRAVGDGIRPVVVRIFAALALTAAALIAVALAISPVLTRRIFDGQWLVFASCVAAFAFYPVSQLVKGVLGGEGDFRRYGGVLAAEGAVRLALGGGLAVLGAATAGPYGLAVAAGPLAAFVYLPLIARRSQEHGTPARWDELSSALAYLCAGSLLSSLLLNGGPVAAKALAEDGEQAMVGQFLAILVVARVPLFLFQAVQVALLPKLARLHAAGHHAEFRDGLARVLRLVVVVGLGSTAAVTLAGPTAIAVVFGSDFVTGRGHLTLLGAGTTVFLLDIVSAQALIATTRYRRMALSWLAGAAGFLAALTAPIGLLWRVELALLTGAVAAAVAMVPAVLAATGDGADS